MSVSVFPLIAGVRSCVCVCRGGGGSSLNHFSTVSARGVRRRCPTVCRSLSWRRSTRLATPHSVKLRSGSSRSWRPCAPMTRTPRLEQRPPDCVLSCSPLVLRCGEEALGTNLTRNNLSHTSLPLLQHPKEKTLGIFEFMRYYTPLPSKCNPQTADRRWRVKWGNSYDVALKGAVALLVVGGVTWYFLGSTERRSRSREALAAAWKSLFGGGKLPVSGALMPAAVSGLAAEREAGLLTRSSGWFAGGVTSTSKLLR